MTSAETVRAALAVLNDGQPSDVRRLNTEQVEAAMEGWPGEWSTFVARIGADHPILRVLDMGPDSTPRFDPTDAEAIRTPLDTVREGLSGTAPKSTPEDTDDPPPTPRGTPTNAAIRRALETVGRAIDDGEVRQGRTATRVAGQDADSDGAQLRRMLERFFGNGPGGDDEVGRGDSGLGIEGTAFLGRTYADGQSPQEGRAAYYAAISEGQDRQRRATERIMSVRDAMLARMPGLYPGFTGPGAANVGTVAGQPGRIGIDASGFSVAGGAQAPFIGYGTIMGADGREIEGAMEDAIRTQEMDRSTLGGFSSADRLAGRAAAVGVTDHGDGTFTPGGDRVIKNPPRYRIGAELDPRGWSPDRVARLQRRLILTGLIDPETVVRRGMFTPVEQAAYRDVLAYANEAGVTEEQAFTEMEADREDTIASAIKDARDAFRPDLSGISQPDPATLRENFRSTIAQLLNRTDISDGEMREMLADAQADLDEQLGIETGRQRAVFERSIAEAQTADVAALPADLRTPEDEAALAAIPDTADLGPTPSVDFAARLQERFRSRYKDELAFDALGDDVRANANRNTQTMGSVADRLGGGRL